MVLFRNRSGIRDMSLNKWAENPCHVLVLLLSCRKPHNRNNFKASLGSHSWWGPCSCIHNSSLSCQKVLRECRSNRGRYNLRHLLQRGCCNGFVMNETATPLLEIYSDVFRGSNSMNSKG